MRVRRGNSAATDATFNRGVSLNVMTLLVPKAVISDLTMSPICPFFLAFPLAARLIADHCNLILCQSQGKESGFALYGRIGV